MDDMSGNFVVILHAGNAKTQCLQAIDYAEEGEFEKAQECLENAQQEINEAHKGHSDSLVKIANGEAVAVDVILIHAQDHLTSATTLHLMAEKMVRMYQRIQER